MLFCQFEKTRDSLIYQLAKKYLTNKKILEIGCGNADRTKLFYQISGKVWAIDIINKVKRKHRGKFKFILANAKKLPFKNEVFDGIVSFDCIEHIDNDNLMLKEAFRICKPGGYLFLGTPNKRRLANCLFALFGKKIIYPYKLGHDIIHLREYTMKELTLLVEHSHFKIIKKMFIFLGLVGRINLGLKHFPKKFNNLSQYLLLIAKK